MDNLSERLRKARTYRKVGQVELSEKIGVSKGTIGNWESDPPQNPPAKLKEVSEALGVSLAYLRGESENMLDTPSESHRMLSRLKITTLQSNLIDLAEGLPSAPKHERKFILGNIREVLDALEELELKGAIPTALPGSATDSTTKQNAASREVVDDILKNPLSTPAQHSQPSTESNVSGPDSATTQTKSHRPGEHSPARVRKLDKP